MQSIDGPHGLTLLGTLIRLLLPLSTHTDTTHTSTPTTHTTTTNGFGPSTSTSMGGASVSQGTANSTLEYCAGAYQLCRLIQQVASITPSRFQLDVTLGVTFGLVGRLWFSALGPWRAAQLAGTAGAAAWRAAPSASHTATPSHTHTGLSTSFGGAAPTSTHMAASTLQVSNSSSVVTSGGSSGHTQGPVPDLEVLGLLCRVFQAQLSVADVSEFYQGVPLPLSEIYDASRPQHGECEDHVCERAYADAYACASMHGALCTVKRILYCVPLSLHNGFVYGLQAALACTEGSRRICTHVCECVCVAVIVQASFPRSKRPCGTSFGCPTTHNPHTRQQPQHTQQPAPQPAQPQPHQPRQLQQQPGRCSSCSGRPSWLRLESCTWRCMIKTV